jgi:hypothetical protein
MCEGCQARDQEIRELRAGLQVARDLATVYARLAERRRLDVGPPAKAEPLETPKPTREDDALRARDAAVLDALLARADGLTSRELLEAMPEEPYLTSDQRYGAYRATLARLGEKVRRERDRFYLTRAGEMAALGL